MWQPPDPIRGRLPRPGDTTAAAIGCRLTAIDGADR